MSKRKMYGEIKLSIVVDTDLPQSESDGLYDENNLEAKLKLHLLNGDTQDVDVLDINKVEWQDFDSFL